MYSVFLLSQHFWTLGGEDMYGYYGFSLPDGSDAGPDMFLHTHVVRHSAVHSENAHGLNPESCLFKMVHVNINTCKSAK